MAPLPTERFSGRVADYVRARPGYPAGVLDLIARALGRSGPWRVADLGSGTGISAELFLRHGHVVHAVEPNAAMRAAAEARFGDRPGFHSVTGTAEATTLPGEACDLVVAAQAFHWFDRAAFLGEVRRILVPDGWLLLMWNTRRTAGAPFLVEYEALLERFGTDYRAVRHGNLDKPALASLFEPAARIVDVFRNVQPLDRDALRARLLSSSYVPSREDPAHVPMLDALDRLFEAHAVSGAVRMEYDTEVFLGMPAACDGDPPRGTPGSRGHS
jgi:SAM-dependent methyltransferase